MRRSKGVGFGLHWKALRKLRFLSAALLPSFLGQILFNNWDSLRPDHWEMLAMERKPVQMIRVLFTILFGIVLISIAGAAPAWAEHYSISYDGSSYDADLDQTTFRYTVVGTGQAPALSHFVVGLPLCDPPISILSTSPAGGEIGRDPFTGVYGIKWDFGVEPDQSQSYSYTVTGEIAEGPVTVVVKAGREIHHTSTLGASCEPGTERCNDDPCNLGEQSCLGGATEARTVPEGMKCSYRGSVRNVGDISADPPILIIDGNGCSLSFPFAGCGHHEWTVDDCHEGDVLWSANDTSYVDIVRVECCIAEQGDACVVGIGVCEQEGVILCDGSCSAKPGKPNRYGEICDNNLDDDCDGEIDETECVERVNISGTAVLQGSGTPVSGVEISGGVVLGATSTNGSGTYSFVDVPNGSYSLLASKLGYVVVSDPNPVVVAGVSLADQDFVLACAEGFVIQEQQCVPVPEKIIVQASDGTFKDYVLVTWTPTIKATSYELYRSEIPGELGIKIATGLTDTVFYDTTATPDQRYHYTIIGNDSVVSNQDEGWRPGNSDECPNDDDCFYEELDPFACASANGFLEQVNIATVINRFSAALDVLVEYRDLNGLTRGRVSARVEPLQKMDFIINDLGLEPDTYGTVCVTMDTQAQGAWSGGVTLYKSNTRDGDPSFGSDFDFVLYYPFANPRTGAYTLPLNTFHLGVRRDGTIANWIRITDADIDDGAGLRGALQYFDEQGKRIGTVQVNLPNGGRFDFSGHEGLAGPDNVDAVGMARFVPEDKQDGTAARYYISLGRYYYQCVGASCNDFYSAFIMPYRPSTAATVSGGVSTINGEISVIELNNTSGGDSRVLVKSYSKAGLSLGTTEVSIPGRATRHTIMNKVGEAGFLENNTVGSASTESLTSSVSAVSLFYKLNKDGVLEYAYAAPLVSAPGVVQLSEFNSFIGNKNTAELYNSTDSEISLQLSANDALNNLVLTLNITLPPKGTKRTELILPQDTYGTLTLQSSQDGVVFRNYVTREGEYVISFPGQ